MSICAVGPVDEVWQMSSRYVLKKETIAAADPVLTLNNV